MNLSSPSFSEGSKIPDKHHYKKGNKSPELIFRGAPSATKSLALLCDDPDAPAGHWSHWVVWDIPPSSSGLREGLPYLDTIADVCHQGVNDFGTTGWGGPCPPHGIHRYIFKLYALDFAIGSKRGMKRPALLDAIKGHVIAEASLAGIRAAD
ncbi:MAG: YbhB/YbcL family Raf kinase inhibitor-like protein [Spirochaetaceae bacterium]|nr:YbhB/YbcL family Raf kinase inhibitor-like protein [Spirochaetaceae bacterium]